MIPLRGFFKVLFFLATLQGNTVLPDTKEMVAHTEAEFDKKKLQGFPPRHYHLVGHSQWNLMNDYANLSGSSPVPSTYKKLFDIVWDRRLFGLVKYKTYSYRTNGNRVQEFLHGTEINTSLGIIIMKLQNIHRIPWRHIPQLVCYILSQIRINAVNFIKP